MCDVQFLEKLNRQERVIEEVKHVLKPHYNKKHITKEQYKDIMRKAVPKVGLNLFETFQIANNVVHYRSVIARAVRSIRRKYTVSLKRT